MHARTLILTLALAAAAITSLATSARPTPRAAEPAGRALLVLTGHDAQIAAPLYTLARSQEILNKEWEQVMGDGGPRAAQGWPLVPDIDFDRCEALLIAGGPSTNTNGYRVVDVIEFDDAVIVRVEAYSFQTASFDGRDRGVPANPWALILIPNTPKTILIEENVQSLIGRDPIWEQRNAFPGRIGVGRPVPGTRQTAESPSR